MSQYLFSKICNADFWLLFSSFCIRLFNETIHDRCFMSDGVQILPYDLELVTLIINRAYFAIYIVVFYDFEHF